LAAHKQKKEHKEMSSKGERRTRVLFVKDCAGNPTAQSGDVLDLPERQASDLIRAGICERTRLAAGLTEADHGAEGQRQQRLCRDQRHQRREWAETRAAL
jgi:hypothetical protein